MSKFPANFVPKPLQRYSEMHKILTDEIYRYRLKILLWLPGATKSLKQYILVYTKCYRQEFQFQNLTG